MRGGLAAPMALAAGLILALLPPTGPSSVFKHPPEPQARPNKISPAQSAYTDAAYAPAASATRTPVATEHVAPRSTPLAAGSRLAPRPEALDVLFVGAHPDDESGDLSTFGQWNEQRHIRTGVLTITRGEGGGNAVGTEEGPALGLLREAEERKAVGLAGISDIAYLDKVDFYYTVSDQLTRSVWDHDSTLAKVVRLVRETRPKVITTMTPSPIPSQHGNHQEAGRLAVEAYYLAADPSAFPSQLTKEHLKPWRAGRLLHQEHLVKSGNGPACETTFTPTDPTADVYGVWAGRTAQGGKTWAQIEAEASRFYASQGWAHNPDPPSDPKQIGCDYLTQVDSRVPFTRGDHDPAAALEGAVYPAAGGLPLGTEFYLTTSAFAVAPGEPFTVTAHAPSGHVALSLPPDWTATGSGDVRHGKAEFAVTAPSPAGRVRLGATVTNRRGTGTTGRAVEVEPAVTGVQQPLPRVSDFDSWASSTGVPQLSGRVKRVLTLASGGSRTVRVDLDDTTGEAHRGTVTLNLPDGFTADEVSKPYDLAAGEHGSVSFTVRNTDTSLPTSNSGGTGGDYDYTISTTVQGAATSVSDAALELVPETTIQEADQAPDVDGKDSSGEYPGPELNLSRLWEGTACESAGDCSATGKVTWYDDALYVLVHVKDDKPGSALDAADCKRHWRTDSVEISLDPRGDAENTSTTFKTGILPVTAGGGGPCFERDADNHQGPGTETAPGMSVASSVASSPYTGYTVETKIPLGDLPTAVDPSRLAMNIFVYDSDTDDKTGQTRIGWSTWGGVQGDPYRWGLATLPGYTPPPDRPTTAPPPVIPSTAALSVNSPQSIIQAASTHVPLAGGPAARALRVVGRPVVTDGSVTFQLHARVPGTVYAYVWDDKIVGQKKVSVGAGTSTVTMPGTSGTLAIAFETAEGGTASIATHLG